MFIGSKYESEIPQIKQEYIDEIENIKEYYEYSTYNNKCKL